MALKFAQKDFEAAVLHRESVTPVYSHLVAFSSLVNPGLNIDGQGTIKFPVPIQNLVPLQIDRSEIEEESQWEIESKHVRSDNANWERFLQDVVRNYDTKASSVEEHAVGLEFRKLILFDSDSSYLPQNCYADGDDNSSILLVFLPSKSPSKDAGAGIDYKLALYYNITSPSNVNFTNTLYAEDNLRRVLVKWNKGKYPHADGSNSSAQYIFYRLSRNYDLGNGKPVLADEDKKMVSFIHCVAEELDFILGFGDYYRSVDCIWKNEIISNVIGKSRALWPSLNCIRKSVEGVGNQQIGEAMLDNPLSCTVMVLFHAKAMYDNLYLHNALNGVLQGLVSSPAKKVEKMVFYIIDLLKGNKSVSFTLSLLQVLYSTIEFTLSRLDIGLWKEAINVSLTNTCYDLVWNNQSILLQSLQVFGFEKVRSSFEPMLDTALFDKLYTFLRAMPFNLAIDDDADAINLWCDDRLRLCLRSFVVDRHVNVPYLIDIAHSHGIHYLLEIHRSGHNGMPLFLADKLIRALEKKKSDILASNANVHFDTVHATAILKGHGCKLFVLSSEHAIDILVDRWLGEAIVYLLSRFGEKGCFNHYSDKIKEYLDWLEMHEDLVARSLMFIELCIFAGQVERCGTILDAIEGSDGIEQIKLQFCIVPLVYRLGPLLQAAHIDVSSPPFALFFQRVIERCVWCFLGTRTRNPQEMFLRQVINAQFRCACKTCTEVKEFLHQLYIPQRYIAGSESALQHIECNTVIFYELADIQMVRQPRIALQITKNQKIFAMQRWENRVKYLQELLRCIGSEHII